MSVTPKLRDFPRDPGVSHVSGTGPVPTTSSVSDGNRWTDSPIRPTQGQRCPPSPAQALGPELVSRHQLGTEPVLPEVFDPIGLRSEPTINTSRRDEKGDRS